VNALDVALKAKMVADTGGAGVNTLASGGIYQAVAPRNIAGVPVGFPRVYFQQIHGTPLYTFNLLVASHFVYQIKALAIDANTEGAFAAGQIDERIQTLLTDPTMTVTGKALLYCRFLQAIPPIYEWDEAISGNIYHKGGYYEVWLA
jgi:hypothetical protein